MGMVITINSMLSYSVDVYVDNTLVSDAEAVMP